MPAMGRTRHILEALLWKALVLPASGKIRKRWGYNHKGLTRPSDFRGGFVKIFFGEWRKYKDPPYTHIKASFVNKILISDKYKLIFTCKFAKTQVIYRQKVFDYGQFWKEWQKKCSVLLQANVFLQNFD